MAKKKTEHQKTWMNNKKNYSFFIQESLNPAGNIKKKHALCI